MRKYSYALGRFTSIDPLWEMYYEWTPYHYCMNNPVNLLDNTGGWAAVWPVNVHKSITEDAAADLGLTDNEIEQMVEGNVEVDEDQKNQYKHAMLSQDDLEAVDGDREAAIEKADKKMKNFIETNINDFIETGDFKKLGAALHTVQDQDCPSHEGWQVWPSGDATSGKNIVNTVVHTLGDLPTATENGAAAERKSKIKTRKYIMYALKKRKEFLTNTERSSNGGDTNNEKQNETN